MRVHEDTLLLNEAVANETTKTEAVSLEHIYGFAVWASWAGTTIAGSISLEASVDGENWIEIVDTEQTISAAGSYLWNVNGAFYKKFRVSVVSDDANVITTTVKFYGKGY